MPVDRSELKLVWPPDLFAVEARALLAAGADDDTFGGLLVEAFHGQRGEQLLGEARSKTAPRRTPASAERIFEWDEPPRATEVLVADLADAAHGLPRFTPRALYSSRQQASGHRLTVEQTKVQFGDLVADLDARGYFEEAFGSHCQDSPAQPEEEGQRKLAARLDPGLGSAFAPELWPTRRRHEDWPRRIEADWNDDLFFDLIEALEEVVARPRQRRAHSYHREWDYGAYHRPAGQAVYRWRVNALLDRSEVGLRLAETGPTAGELGQAAGDPRDQLAENVPATTSPNDRVEVGHAVRLFNARGATREHKRSAVVALARVLESRRRLLKRELLSKDEGALFHIANEFDVRHRTSKQQGDYDDAFLNWVFWWYLATVELTDNLLIRQRRAT